MTLPDDEVLLRAIAQKDRVAFDTFVGRHQASVFRYLRAAARDDADAEDALQEAFISVWQNASGFRGGASARGWLLTIGRNALLKAHRKKVGEPSSHESLESIGLQCGWGTEMTALDEVVQRDLLERVLGGMRPEDREILVVRELEGFSGEEVAEMLELSLPAMKSRLHRARLRFVAALRWRGGRRRGSAPPRTRRGRGSRSLGGKAADGSTAGADLILSVSRP